jgi:hypothetical protein
MDDVPPMTIAEAVDAVPGTALSQLLQSIIEFTAGDKIDGRGSLERGFGQHGHMGANEADREPWVYCFKHLCDLDVRVERGRAGMEHREFMLGGKREDVA